MALNPNLIRELLNTVQTPEGKPLGDELQNAVERLASLVEQANTHLTESELANITAKTLAREQGITGKSPVFRVQEDGTVVVESARKPKKTRKKLPKLREIRRKAEKLGMTDQEIEAFGIRRRELWDHLDCLEATLANDKPMSAGPDEVQTLPPLERPKRGFRKTAPAISVVHDVNLDPNTGA